MREWRDTAGAEMASDEWPEGRTLDVAVMSAAMILLAATLGLSAAMGGEVGERLTRNTVRLSLAWYVMALCAMLWSREDDWLVRTIRGRLTRWCWTVSLAYFLVHLGMAFHFYHRWSHTDAFERTRQISGVGEGIYVSYFFVWLWICDVAIWWLSPESVARRSVWIDRSLHAFMLFIVFNGKVVFETGFIRWAGVALFAVLACAWWLARGYRGSDPERMNLPVERL
jgi:hypothetical protein